VWPRAAAPAGRPPAFAEVPTAAGARVGGYVVPPWYAMWAPAGTPPDIVEKMSQEILKALESPKLKELWASNGSATPNMTGAKFGQFVDAEIERWAGVVKDAGVQPQ